MEVRIRTFEELPTHLCTISDDNLEEGLNKVINFLKHSGGVHVFDSGNDEPFDSYQLVLDEDTQEFYVEILIGKEEGTE